MTRCANDTGRVGVKSSALWGSVRGAAREAAESRVQITSVVSGFAHDSCIGAVLLHGSGFAAVTSSARAQVRRILSGLIVHLSKLGKRKQCVLYSISFSAVGGATSVFELSRADIFSTSNSSRESRDDCNCSSRHATIQQFAARGKVGSLFDDSRLLFATQ